MAVQPLETSSTTSSTSAPRDRDDFHVAILCALSLEATAVIDALDHHWNDKKYKPPSNDVNQYTLGAIGEHNIVIVHLPGPGTDAAAAAARGLRSSYQNIKLALVVGICGGMPKGVKDEILLGDVVISKALIQYDVGKTYPNGFKRVTDVLSTLGRPDEKIRALLSKLEARQHKQTLQSRTAAVLRTIQGKSSGVEYPGSEHDVLYISSYTHKHRKPGQCHTCEMPDEVCETALNSDCEALGCEAFMLVHRQRLTDAANIQPVIHIGKMGCANTVLKSGQDRDTLARSEGIIAVEMEGAGVWQSGSSILIKGVSDYADSHKNKIWQQYAATTAAACAKALLLESWDPERRDEHSGPINAHFDIPIRQKVNTLSYQENMLQSTERAPPRSNRRASRHEGELSEQLDGGDEQRVRPNQRSTEDNDDDAVGACNSNYSIARSSKSARSWEDYLQSLEFDRMDERKRIVKSNSKGTCEWLLTCLDYKQWLQQKGLFVVQGNPGCGKSTLVKYVLSQQQSRADQESSEALNISFFFCRDGMELESSMDGMLRSLLWQLVNLDWKLRGPFCDLCRAIFPVRMGKETDLMWTGRHLQETFEELLAQASVRHDVKIFIDAVDELQDQDFEELMQFFRSLNSPTQARPSKIGLFITCRRTTSIQVEPLITIQLDKKNHGDIRSFLAEQLLLPDETQEDREDLKTTLEKRAEGSFLWLVMLLPGIRKSSRKGKSVSDMKEDILQCPRELSAIYNELLENIDEAEGNEVSALFQWICFAARPLSVEEFRIALIIHTNEVLSSIEEYTRKDRRNNIPNGRKLRNRVTSLSQGLVDFSTTDTADDSALVRFYHESILDFMHKEGLDMIQSKVGRADDLTKPAHAQLTNTCLRFLATEEVRDAMWNGKTDTLNRYAFFAYARDHWYEHAMYAEKNRTADAVDWTLHVTLPAWIRVRQHSDKNNPSQFVEGTQPIHIAAYYGLVTLARELLGDDCVIEASGTQTAAKPNAASSIKTQPNRSGTNYTISARSNRSLKTKDQSNVDRFGLGIVKSSASSGRHNVAVANRAGAGSQPEKSRLKFTSPINTVQKGSPVSIKQKRYADVIDGQDAMGVTPLIIAASAGHLAMVKLLCEVGADVHLQDKMTWTPLFAASIRGHVDVIEYLLNRGADIHATTRSGLTPLYSASAQGHSEAVKYLLEHGAGADVNVLAEQDWTPLIVASVGGHLKVVEYLLERGADVHATTKGGQTSLYAASRKGHTKVVERLLEHKANIHARNENDWTALCTASSNGCLEVIECLFKHGASADVDVANKGGWTPLNAASDNGHLKVVEYLLKCGADVHATTSSGQTPLYSASVHGHSEVVKYLFKHGASVHTRNENGWTPLSAASSYGHLKVVEYLLQDGIDADIHMSTKDGQTPLYVASQNGYVQVVEWLFKHGASVDVRTRDNSDWTPLCAASENGHLKVVEYLLQNGADADVHMSTKDNQTPLYAASRKGHLEVVKCLFQHGAGAEIHTSHENGWTPLSVASSNGHLEVVKYLFERGASTDIHKPTKAGWTPLYAASKNGHVEVVKYLLQNGADTDIDNANENGWTPLNIASFNGHLEVVKYLFECEVEVDIHKSTKAGWTPLYAASKNGHVEVVKYLLQHGADTDMDNATGDSWTPLYAASRYDHSKVVQALLESGADANVRGPSGQTPLICSVVRSLKLITQHLLSFSTDTTITDNYGRTAADWLKLLKTDDELLERLGRSNSDTPLESIVKHLHKSIVSTSAAVLDGRVEDSATLFNYLGHYFLALDDTEQAHLAFQQKIEVPAQEEANIQHDVICDLCLTCPIQGSRFVCKTCYDTDLCKSCMNKYRSGEHFAACNQHTYIEVVKSSPKPLDNDFLRGWLQENVKRYARSD